MIGRLDRHVPLEMSKIAEKLNMFAGYVDEIVMLLRDLPLPDDVSALGRKGSRFARMPTHAMKPHEWGTHARRVS